MKSVSFEIGKLVKKMEDQKIGLPEFQRDFVWEPKQMASLAMSIIRGYPIGAFLFLNMSKNNHMEPRDIAGIEISDNRRCKLIVMDGQQRLTTLYLVRHQKNKGIFDYRSAQYSLFLGLDKLKKKNIHNLDEEFVYPRKVAVNDDSFINDEDEQINYKEMPFYVLWDDEKRKHWLDRAVRCGKIGKRTKQLLNNIARKIKTFELPVHFIDYKISDQALCNIFELINNSGTELNNFDIAVANLQKHGIKLRKLWAYAKSQDNFKPEKYDIDGNYILKTIFLVRKVLNHTKKRTEISATCTKRDISNITKLYHSKKVDKHFNRDWNKAIRCMNESLDYLNGEFGADCSKKLPYSPMLVVLSSILWWADERKIKKDISFVKKLKSWYWRSIFNHRYDQSTNQKIADDFYDLRLLIKGEKKKNPFERIKTENLGLFKLVNNRDAVYKAILCLPYLQQARDLTSPRSLKNANVMPLLKQALFKLEQVALC